MDVMISDQDVMIDGHQVGLAIYLPHVASSRSLVVLTMLPLFRCLLGGANSSPSHEHLGYALVQVRGWVGSLLLSDFQLSRCLSRVRIQFTNGNVSNFEEFL